jgi:hypothetical protein
MLRTIVSKSGLGLLAEDIYYLLESGERMLLSMTANDTADTLTLKFKNKDSSVGTDTAESLVMMVKDNKANELAEAIVKALNGTNVKSQIVKLVEGAQQFEDSKGVSFTFAYESGVANEDLEIDPDNAALADETVTIGFQNLVANSGPYRCEAFIKNTDSTGEEDVVINGTQLQTTVTADANGKFELSIPGVYDASGTTTAIPITDTGIVNTAEVTLTAGNMDNAVSVSSVIAITHQA